MYVNTYNFNRIGPDMCMMIGLSYHSKRDTIRFPSSSVFHSQTLNQLKSRGTSVQILGKHLLGNLA